MRRNVCGPPGETGREVDALTGANDFYTISAPSDSPLRQALEDAMAESGYSMPDLTVFDKHYDPFRIDTPSNHRDGKWLADTAADLGLGTRKIHPRGLHYMVLGRTKPDGSMFVNTDAEWEWLSGKALNSARWLGYIGFDQIEDHKNAPPVVREFSRPWTRPYISVGLQVEIPSVENMEPSAYAFGFEGVQPYKIVMFGEKSSLEPVLGPVAQGHDADLYLSAGAPSLAHVHQMAATAVTEDRPLVVLCFTDSDPSGWQMPISIGRQLQAFRAALFPGLEFRVVRAALTPDQVREHDLPSTPMKASELRGDKWRAAMGADQTEIDALAALRPDLLRRIALDAIRPYYDSTLNRRVYEARDEWTREANEVLAAGIDQDALDRIRSEAADKLGELRDQIDALNEQLHVEADDYDLPEMVVPEAEISGVGLDPPLIDSQWTFAEQSRALIDSKAYAATSTGGAS